MSGDSRAAGANTADQDATMADVGEKGRPPGDPPDVAGSWVKKVVGSSAGGMPVPEEFLDDVFVSSRLQLDFPDGEEGEPVITIGHEVLDAMNGLWKQCMIVKVLGRNLAISVLSRKLRELWNPKGAMYVLDLPRQFFMVRFELEEEYMAALTGGPWRAFGSYLMVQAWSPDFDPLRNEIVTTPVWVRLSNIPVNLYHRSILMGIARGLGKPVRVDLTTLNFERARFARICVEINLSKPLKGSVLINGERYYVAYEGLNNICSGCGMYGHLIHGCPRVVMEKSQAEAVQTVIEKTGEVAIRDDGFTVVRRGGRRSEGPSRGVVAAARRPETGLAIIKGNNNVVTKNRFGNLETGMVRSELTGGNIASGANKENQMIADPMREGKSVGQAKFGGVFGGSEKGGESGKAGPSDKRAGQMKPMETNGPKSKHFKQNRPTKGLVFGGSKEVIVMKESGKRLRVEKPSVGRPGGVLTTATYSNPVGENSNQGAEVGMNDSQQVTEATLLNREIVMVSDQSGGGVTGVLTG